MHPGRKQHKLIPHTQAGENRSTTDTRTVNDKVETRVTLAPVFSVGNCCRSEQETLASPFHPTVHLQFWRQCEVIELLASSQLANPLTN